MNKYLEPVESIFSLFEVSFEYYCRVRKTLFQGLSQLPEASFQVMPSFTPESVWQITCDDKAKNQYQLTYHIAAKMIWHTPTNEAVTIFKHKKQLQKSDAELVIDLWKTAIRQTRYDPNKGIGLDGCSYFVVVRDVVLKTGKTWSPHAESPMGQLVAIGVKIAEWAEHSEENAPFNPQILSMINELKAILSQLDAGI